MIGNTHMIGETSGCSVNYNFNQVILDSWERCCRYKLDHHNIPCQNPPLLKELIGLIDNNRMLIQSSMDVIDQLASFCNEYERISAIFNDKGILLYYNASECFKAISEVVNIFTGTCWSEEKMGTNAAGTVLECKHPLIVNDREHYFKQLWGTTWIGAPVHDTHGNMTGVVCVGLYNSDTLDTIYDKTIWAVKNIENNLCQKHKNTPEHQHMFFSEIVHESRNALTACEGFIQFMLIKKMFNSEYLEIVLSELRRTTTILNSYNQIASPHRNLEYCNLNKCINEVLTLFSSKLKLRHIDVDLSLSEIPDIFVDPSRMKQILLNMIENSIDAIEKNGCIGITTFCFDNTVTIVIKDTGCGIDSSVMNKIFTPFFTTKSKGTGLGLHVCRTIIESYNGKISLESSPGMGTIFTISFPVISEAQNPTPVLS